eukprot:4444622-Prymnesium_polylepis.3
MFVDALAFTATQGTFALSSPVAKVSTPQRSILFDVKSEQSKSTHSGENSVRDDKSSPSTPSVSRGPSERDEPQRSTSRFSRSLLSSLSFRQAREDTGKRRANLESSPDDMLLEVLSEARNAPTADYTLDHTAIPWTSQPPRVSPTTVAQGDHFGAETFILGTPHTCDLVAANSCECLLLYRRPFIELLRRFPQLSAELMKTAEVCSRRRA